MLTTALCTSSPLFCDILDEALVEECWKALLYSVGAVGRSAPELESPVDDSTVEAAEGRTEPEVS